MPELPAQLSPRALIAAGLGVAALCWWRRRPRRAPIVLVDMDGVLADFDRECYKRVKARSPQVPLPSFDQRCFPIASGVPEEHRPDVNSVILEPGFFDSLPPIPGGREALEAMQERGYSVFICTAPLKTGSSASEKIEWVRRHLGQEWVEKVVLTRDKTMVRGDVLIDDAPQAKGLSSGLTPEWTHVYFAAPYNAPERYPQGAHRRRLETWADWPKVLNALCPLVSKPRAPVTRSESKQLL